MQTNLKPTERSRTFFKHSDFLHLRNGVELDNDSKHDKFAAIASLTCTPYCELLPHEA